MTDKNGKYTDPTRKADPSFMDTLVEIGTAVMEGFRGSQRASQNPASEAIRARQRTEQREGKAYGGRTKMAYGGKAHGKKK